MLSLPAFQSVLYWVTSTSSDVKGEWGSDQYDAMETTKQTKAEYKLTNN